MKTTVEGIFAKVSASRDYKRRMAQAVYDAYEFNLRVESGDPKTAWFQTFDSEVPVMTRKIVVFREGEPAVTGWFKVEFDKTGSTVEDAYAYAGKDKQNHIGRLPEGFALSSVTGAEDDAPTTGWKM